MIVLIAGCGEPNNPNSAGEEGYEIVNTIAIRSLAKDMSFLGDTLFVAEHNDGFALYDISEPAQISLLRRISEAEKCKLIHVEPGLNALFVSTSLQTYIYFLDSLKLHINSVLGDEGAICINTSILYGQVDNDAYQWDTDYIRLVKTNGMASLTLAKVFLDTTPFEPHELFFNKEDDIYLDWEIPTSPSGIRALENNNHFAVSLNEVGVAFADLTDEFRWISDVNTPGKATETAQSGDYLYVADDYFGVAIIDISDLTAPRYISSYKVDGFDHINGLALDGDRLVLVDEYDGLLFLDLKNPVSPQHIGTYEIREPTKAEFDPQSALLYVTSFEEGITVIELLY